MVLFRLCFIPDCKVVKISVLSDLIVLVQVYINIVYVLFYIEVYWGLVKTMTHKKKFIMKILVSE